MSRNFELIKQLEQLASAPARAAVPQPSGRQPAVPQPEPVVRQGPVDRLLHEA